MLEAEEVECALVLPNATDAALGGVAVDGSTPLSDSATERSHCLDAPRILVFDARSGVPSDGTEEMLLPAERPIIDESPPGVSEVVDPVRRRFAGLPVRIVPATWYEGLDEKMCSFSFSFSCSCS